MLAWIEGKDPFPPVERALKNPNGLLAAGGELSSERLLEAYRRGVFPWYSGVEPVLWWSPDPRMVLYCDELKVARSLGKSLRNKGYEVTVDTAFAEVLEGCAHRPQGTWLGAGMKKAYLRLHRAGHAHSFETWRGTELAGGLYGVAIGRMFYGESMFSQATDASKVALVSLVGEL
ncbi:MAG TPA: leucyl/phenylalanyl-tRNA--protein transferase, partial [Candidatus Limnocylindrales bacterium]|nr:leucyl/phenylalanyl-tRNA--protein transferase [Candidatus Limnocylindrales bacterium]